jgi:uroporphyrinogen decarboxylase
LKDGKKLIDTLKGATQKVPPLWIMRQAGRYLPEYRQTRERVGSFWNLCMTPGFAAEVTLQPIRRFGFDAAIIFSDILVIPAALGMTVTFEAGEGPKLTPFSGVDRFEIDREKQSDFLEPVYEALRQTRAALGSSTALLGFAGAPWTLATYIAAGGGGDEQKAAKLLAYRNPVQFSGLIDVLVECVSQHLIAQLRAGADAVQIFDSWAGGLPPQGFQDWVVGPTKQIVSRVKAVIPHACIIGFPRAATLNGYALYARETGVDAVSLDTAAPMDWAAQTIAPGVALQGNLDPIALIAGGRALGEGVDRILKATEGVPFVFNLGHGILPETPIAHVEELVRLVRGVA